MFDFVNVFQCEWRAGVMYSWWKSFDSKLDAVGRSCIAIHFWDLALPRQKRFHELCSIAMVWKPTKREVLCLADWHQELSCVILQSIANKISKTKLCMIWCTSWCWCWCRRVYEMLVHGLMFTNQGTPDGPQEQPFSHQWSKNPKYQGLGLDLVSKNSIFNFRAFSVFS